MEYEVIMKIVAAGSFAGAILLIVLSGFCLYPQKKILVEQEVESEPTLRLVTRIVFWEGYDRKKDSWNGKSCADSDADNSFFSWYNDQIR